MSASWSAVSSTLIASLWQFSLIAGLAWVALRCVDRNNGRLRHAIAFGGLLLLPLSFAAAIWQAFGDPPLTLPVASTATPSPHILLPALWALGIVWQVLALGRSWQRVVALKASAFVAADAALLAKLNALRSRLGIARLVSLRLTLKNISPCTIGMFKPIIFLPIACLTRLSSDEVEALLAHELAHIRRWDFLSAWLQQLVKTLFYYHPAMHYLLRQTEQECEHACDDWVASATPHARPLASALLRLTLANESAAPALNATGPVGCLRRRVERLTGIRRATNASSGRLLPSIALLVCVALAFGTLPLSSGTEVAASLRLSLSRPELVELKREVCDQLSADDIYWTQPYDNGGPVHLSYSPGAILINNVPLPAATQSALRTIFGRYGIEGEHGAQLRYYYDQVSLSAQPSTAPDSNSPAAGAISQRRQS